MNKNTLAILLGAALLAPTFVHSATAQERYRDEPDRRREVQEHRYYEHDMDRWHRGYWVNEWHEGRDGWWWVIDGAWYYYPAPIYPYPDPYALPMVAPPPETVVQPAPPPQAPYCREYHGDAIINGSSKPFYGTACLEQDGAWHIVK